MTERTRRVVRAHIIGCLAAFTIVLAAFGPSVHDANAHWWDVDMMVKVINSSLDNATYRSEGAYEVTFKDGHTETIRIDMETAMMGRYSISGWDVLYNGSFKCHVDDIVSYKGA